MFDPLLPPFVKDHIQQQKQIWDIMCLAASSSSLGRIQYIYCILVLTALSHIMQLPSSDFSHCYDNDHPTCMTNPSYYEELRIIHSNFTNRNVMLLILGGNLLRQSWGRKISKTWKFPTKIPFFPQTPVFPSNDRNFPRLRLTITEADLKTYIWNQKIFNIRLEK